MKIYQLEVGARFAVAAIPPEGMTAVLARIGPMGALVRVTRAGAPTTVVEMWSAETDVVPLPEPEPVRAAARAPDPEQLGLL